MKPILPTVKREILKLGSDDLLHAADPAVMSKMPKDPTMPVKCSKTKDCATDANV
jgi:hypothetical protein